MPTNPVKSLSKERRRREISTAALASLVRSDSYRKNCRNRPNAVSFHGTWVSAGERVTKTGGFSPMRLRVTRVIDCSMTEPRFTCSMSFPPFTD